MHATRNIKNESRLNFFSKFVPMLTDKLKSTLLFQGRNRLKKNTAPFKNMRNSANGCAFIAVIQTMGDFFRLLLSNDRIVKQAGKCLNRHGQLSLFIRK